MRGCQKTGGGKILEYRVEVQASGSKSCLCVCETNSKDLALFCAEKYAAGCWAGTVYVLGKRKGESKWYAIGRDGRSHGHKVREYYINDK